MESAGPLRNPAEELLGLVVNTDWKVAAKLHRPPGATGGQFSVGYIVENSSGHKAFLKALDYSKALRSEDPAKVLQGMTEAFNFERNILGQCKHHRLDRVVFAIDEGKISLPEWPFPVQFLIFDLAETDIRSLQKVGQAFDLAWTLRSLHQIAVGIWQLHKHDIAHQDLKPSNILVFKDDQMKLADLGRAECKNLIAPHSTCTIAGARPYAPPELLYGEISSDWECRRFGCDLYHLGSMVVFFFCGIQMTAILKSKLHPNHIWTMWAASYRDALPYVRDAFERALEEISVSIPTQIRTDVIIIIKQLCEPDPLLRGHPENRIGHTSPYSVERYISFFDLYARKAELGLLKSISNGN